VAFLIVVVTFVGQFALAGRREPDLFRAVLRLVWTTLPGGVLILAAAFVPFEVRPVLWLVALAYDFVGPASDRCVGGALSLPTSPSVTA
jgi:low temperature requirement protein LtrA